MRHRRCALDLYERQLRKFRSLNLFFTEPSFEQYMPEGALGEECLWRAVGMFCMSHWYLFQYVSAEREQAPETALLADEWSLIAKLNDVPQARRCSICRFQRESLSGRWAMKSVDSLWLAAPIELEATGVLLVRFEGATDLLDSRLEALPPRDGRRLLFQATPPSRPLAPLSP